MADNAFRPGSDHRTKYTHDGLYRLKKVEEGNGAGSNFTASYGTEDWAPSINSVNKPLSQTGNWNGAGGPSYIESVVTPDRDNAAWNAAAQSGTGENAWAIEYSEFVLQNWRADVVRTVSAGGAMGAQIRYTAYGEPASFSNYDIAGGGSGLSAPDGNLDGEDYSAFLNAFAAEDALADMVGGDGNAPGDGSVDGNDFAAFMNAYGAGAGLVGPGVLSSEGDAGLRRGHAGYEFHPVLGLAGASVYHVRNRVYDEENGRWTKRDPLGYVDGPSMYEYCQGMAMEARDAMGLAAMVLCDRNVIATCQLLTLQSSINAMIPCAAAIRLMKLAPNCLCALPTIIGLDAVQIANCLQGARNLAQTFASTAVAALVGTAEICGIIYKAYKSACTARSASCPAGLPCADYGPILENIKSCIRMRKIYIMSGCDTIFPTTRNHPGQILAEEARLRSCEAVRDTACGF